MQLSFVFRAARRSAWLALAILLSACGGGGGGDSGSGSGGGPPPASSGRTGQMVYLKINQVLAVNMAAGTTRTLFAPDLNRSYVGTGVGPNGELAVAYNSSTTGPTSTLTILKPDGTTEVSTTYSYLIKGQPKFSPDGSKLAFTAGVYEGGSIRYFTQMVSRSGEELFYFDNLDRPGWTPDGRLIMISEDGNLDLYLSAATLPGPLTLIPNSSNIGSFSVHPDGTKIAFSRGVGGAARHIYVMNIDGTATAQVTTSYNSEEAWVGFSPNGAELLLTSAGCISASASGETAGDVDRDLIHLIPADSRMLDIRGLANSGASTRLLDESGSTRCADSSPSWR
jgi:Tol biopolymer transport system component